LAPESESKDAPAGGTPAEDKSYALRVEGVAVSYQGVRALRGVSIQVGLGEVVALVGANGAGKTSLLNSIMGLVRPDEGSITVQGVQIAGLEPWDIRRLGVGYAPEGRRLFSGLTVRQNIICGALHIDRRRREQGLEYVLTLFPELKDRLGQLVETLSGGQQQMVAVSRALVDIPKLLLLDELSLGLAPVVTSRLFRALEELKQGDVSVLLVEQNVRRALEAATRGYVIVEGSIEFAGESDALLRDTNLEHAYLGL
jgi:branched-chain amino acid transport system ATP-binding protein